MEGIEMFHAEVAQPASVIGSYVEVARERTLVAIDHLALSRHAIFSPTGTEAWTFGRDLLHAGLPVGVPLDCVVLPMRSAHPSSLFSFQATSNGLASGNNGTEALTVALLEVIERDAVAAWRGAAEWFGKRLPKVRLDTVRQFPLADGLLDRIERAGMRVLVYDCTVDTHVPVFRALLYEASERQIGIAEGSGAHLDPELALVRALTEAAQARCVAIAGARDDRFGRDLARIRLTDSRRRIAELESTPATVDVRAHTTSSAANATFDRDVALLLERLADVGVEQAVVFDLTLPAFREALSVVRVVVPGLDGPAVVRDRPSPRAAKLARLHQ
jgi:ribosomal protein S12 methylthiotransferase accessory factor